MNEANPISPKSMWMETFNIINIIWCLVSGTKNFLLYLNDIFGMISFLMDIPHKLPQKMIQLLTDYSSKDSLSQPQHTFVYTDK